LNSYSRIIIGPAVLIWCAASGVGAQAVPDTARCEAVVRSARVDSVPVGLFASAMRVDSDLWNRDGSKIAMNVAAVFVPPKPLQLSVFSGPARTHMLRSLSGDTTVDLRAPTITGVYRISSTKGDTAIRVGVVRASLVIGFDSSVIAAIHSAALIKGLFDPPPGDDSMRLNVRFSTDSIAGAQRFISAAFPRLPVVDALPLSSNPSAPFPAEAIADSLDRGEVVFRMVVDRNGLPALDAVEIVRSTADSFVRSALSVLPQQRFRPATVKGCPVAQVIDYPFTFEHSSSAPPERH
jgi:hypothetical protein